MPFTWSNLRNRDVIKPNIALTPSTTRSGSGELIENTTIIIPSYPPHYNYVYHFLKQLKQIGNIVDVHIVFSNQSDFLKFEMKDDIIPIIIACEINTKCLVTYKKFYGLKNLIDSNYDYFIVCDSEISIVPDNFNKKNIDSFITRYFSNKTLYAGNVEGSVNQNIAYSVSQECMNLFDSDHHKTIIEKTLCHNLYAWFSNIPVYKRNNLYIFFDSINENKIKTIFAFDYVIYQYFLVLYEGFNIVNTTPITGLSWSTEFLSKNVEISVIEELTNIGWTPEFIDWKLKEHPALRDKVLLYFHLDRI